MIKPYKLNLQIKKYIISYLVNIYIYITCISTISCFFYKQVCCERRIRTDKQIYFLQSISLAVVSIEPRPFL
jgi:hypothetical protein